MFGEWRIDELRLKHLRMEGCRIPHRTPYRGVCLTRSERERTACPHIRQFARQIPAMLIATTTVVVGARWV